MKNPREADRRRRVAQIAALALIWAGAVTALVSERARGRKQAPPKPATVRSGEVSVDIARTQLRNCRIEAVSFRTRDEGWVTDACGHAFHTTDAGVTFEPLRAGGDSLAFANPGDDEPMVGEVSRIEWLSDTRAVAFAADIEKGDVIVLASSDAGATWRRQPLREDGFEWIYASDHVGQTVWACGLSGTIFRSRDGGASFARTRGTPFDGDDRCIALSFSDTDQGWAGGMDGTLYSTLDGGDSWTRRRVPLQPRPTGATTTSNKPVFDITVSGLVHLPSGETWVAMRKDRPGESPPTWTFRTFDGGHKWAEAKPAIGIAAALAHGGRWGDGAVFARDGRLVFEAGNGLIRDTPLVGAGAGAPAREVIRGREPLEPGHVSAWTDHAIVETFDDGRSWSTLARVPDGQRIRRSVHPAPAGRGAGEWSQWALVELADGSILRGWDQLAPSTQPEFDRFVMAISEAHRRGAPPPSGPLDCLATATTGSIDVRGGVRGCDEMREQVARLAWDEQGAKLSLQKPKLAVAVSREQRRRFVAAVADAVQRPDDGNHGCTTEMFVDLTWRCGGAPPLHAAFGESHCSQPGGPPETGPAHRVEHELGQLLVSRATGRR